jgi:hypothetical protein
VLLGLGVAFWVSGVVGVHFLAPLGVFSGRWSWALLVGTGPAAWGTVRLIKRVSGVAGGALPGAVAMVSMPALLLDGVAMTWAPFVYVGDAAAQRAVGAWLLWFVGVSLVVAFLRARAGAPTRSAAPAPQ